jgi:hypothetical protein
MEILVTKNWAIYIVKGCHINDPKPYVLDDLTWKDFLLGRVSLSRDATNGTLTLLPRSSPPK